MSAPDLCLSAAGVQRYFIRETLPSQLKKAFSLQKHILAECEESRKIFVVIMLWYGGSGTCRDEAGIV